LSKCIKNSRWAISDTNREYIISDDWLRFRPNTRGWYNEDKTILYHRGTIMALQKIEQIGKICHICDESGKFFDEDEKEIKTPFLLRQVEK